MNRDRLVLRALALLAIIVGILSLLGVRPMNSRTVEVTLGTVALVIGLVLLGMTLRAKSAGAPTPIA
ncbi:MAG TPA: hypothetical protein VES92_10480 [Nitrospiraceae bacterium]|nr:hypothetical protein [Nitrospiraceae bacterium]